MTSPVVRRERIGVQVAGRIDAHTRITVVQPVAPRCIVLVDQQIRQTHLLHALRRDNAGHPGPDDEHSAVAWHAAPAWAGALGGSDPPPELLGAHQPITLVNALPD